MNKVQMIPTPVRNTTDRPLAIEILASSTDCVEKSTHPQRQLCP